MKWSPSLIDTGNDGGIDCQCVAYAEEILTDRQHT